MSHEEIRPSSDKLTCLTITATDHAVRNALAEARIIWASQDASPDHCAAAEQVLAEVLNNVVEHSQAGRSEGVVQLGTLAKDGKIHCLVQDDGKEMPGLELPAGHQAAISDDLQSLPEGGFGWFMIRRMTHDLSYDRVDGWNHLWFSVISDPPT